jgi:KipI family sensor histidine kinase inhibitor
VATNRSVSGPDGGSRAGGVTSAGWPRLAPAGDDAVLVRFGAQIDRQANLRAHALAGRLGKLEDEGIEACVPGYCTLLVQYDPALLAYAEAAEIIHAHIGPALDAPPPGRVVELPVVYGGAEGPDMAFVAERNRLAPEEVLRRHAAVTYTVAMMGFTPGFPYLMGLDETIAAPRLAVPRQLVPAGSVGIAGSQTGVYPLDSPGGWRIIGRTDAVLFDAAKAQPFLLSPGDEVRFVPVEGR